MPWKAREHKATAKYEALFTAGSLTTSEIANALGYSHMGCLSSLYKLEKRGRIKRIGIKERPPNAPRGRGQIIWSWVPQTAE